MKGRNHDSLIFKGIVELKELLNLEYSTRYICFIKMKYINFYGLKWMIVIVAESRNVGESICRSILWMIGYICHSLINNMHESYDNVVEITNLNFSFLPKLQILNSLINLLKYSTFGHYRRNGVKSPMLWIRFSTRDLDDESE